MVRKKGARYAPAQQPQTSPTIPPEIYAPQSYGLVNFVPNNPNPAADSWRPQPNQWPPQPSSQGFSADLPSRSQPPRRQQNLQSRVSQPHIYSIVDSWRSYRADENRYPQEPAPSNGPASYNTPPWRPSQNNAHRQNQFRPQAPSFEPGQRLVNGFQPHSNYRIDKSSRYNLRSNQQRSFTTAAAERVIQSIETDNPQVQQLPIRTTPQGKNARRREPTPINKSITPVPVPVPSAAYDKRAQEAPAKVEQPRKLLVLLDLNGTLVYRHGSQRQFSVKRPGVDRLLEYLFEHHAVLIFTSATMRSAEKMAQELLTPKQYGELITIRAREHLGLKSEQFYNKVQVYKELHKIWSVPEVKQSAKELGTTWDMTNTILIDDSIEKARSHPHNLLQVPEFMHAESSSAEAQRKWTKTETDIMKGVEAKLEELKYHSNVACQIREWQEGKISPGSTSETVNDSKLHAFKEGATQDKEPAPATSEEPTDYPTPTSLSRGSALPSESQDDDEDDGLQGVMLPTLSSEVSDAQFKKPSNVKA